MLVVVCEDAVSYTEDVSLDLFIVKYIVFCPTVVSMYNSGTQILQGLQQCTGAFIFLVVCIEGCDFLCC